MKRTTATSACAVMALAGFVLASPASAADLGTVTLNGSTLSNSNLSGAVNDTFTFSYTSGGSAVYLLNDTGSASVGGTACTMTIPVQSNCSVTSPNAITVTVTALGKIKVFSNNLSVGEITITAGGSGGTGTARSSTPAPIVQQFGKPATTTCDASAPATLDWAGVASGGWSESWAQWANAGRGSAVCTRTLAYSVQQAKWVVG